MMNHNADFTAVQTACIDAVKIIDAEISNIKEYFDEGGMSAGMCSFEEKLMSDLYELKVARRVLNRLREDAKFLEEDAKAQKDALNDIDIDALFNEVWNDLFA